MGWSVGTSSIKLGACAGEFDQAENSVAIGYHSGQYGQGIDSVAIGSYSGNQSQGDHCITIGASAGEDDQHEQTIVMSATNEPLTSTRSAGMYIKPIRNGDLGVRDHVMRYNHITGEVSRSEYSGIASERGGKGVVPSASSVDGDGLLSVVLKGKSCILGNIRGPTDDSNSKGADGGVGRLVSSAVLTPEEDLTMKFTKGSDQPLCNVRGAAGSDGVLVQSVVTNCTGDTIITLSDGREIVLSGGDGVDGLRGYGIDTKTHVDSFGDLQIVLENGVLHNAGSVLGEMGESGPVGPTGPSGIQLERGERGPTGPEGDSGATGLKGNSGPEGPAGDSGSGGEVGATGPTGPTGPDGGVAALASGSCVSDYLYYTGEKWDVGGSDVRIGCGAGVTSQGALAVAVGTTAGMSNQGEVAVAIGNEAGAASQGDGAVALGPQAGKTNQGQNSVAIGKQAGETDQGVECVAIGAYAGKVSQGEGSVAVGYNAGRTNAGINSVCIGDETATKNSGEGSIAIGFAAGRDGIGKGSIMIGHRAGILGSVDGSIMIKGRVMPDSAVNEPGLHIAAPRNMTGPSSVYYNPSTGEISYGSSSLATKKDVEEIAEDDMDSIVASVLTLKPKLFKYKNTTKVRSAAGDVTEVAVEGVDDETPPSERTRFVSSTPIEEREEDLEFFGLIADEVDLVCPELVHKDLYGNVVDIKWNDLLCLMMEAVNRQTARIADLKTEVKNRQGGAPVAAR